MSGRSGYLGGHDSSVCDARKCISDKKRIPTNFLNLVIAKVGCVARINNLLNECGINRFLENQRILDLVGGDCLLVDPWNSLGTDQVFAFATETAAMRALAATAPPAAMAPGPPAAAPRRPPAATTL